MFSVWHQWPTSNKVAFLHGQVDSETSLVIGECATQSSHSLDWARWQAKMASIQIVTMTKCARPPFDKSHLLDSASQFRSWASSFLAKMSVRISFLFETATENENEKSRFREKDKRTKIAKRLISPLGLHQWNNIRGPRILFHWWSPSGETFGNLRSLILFSKSAFVFFRSLLLSQIKKFYGFSRPHIIIVVKNLLCTGRRSVKTALQKQEMELPVSFYIGK